MTRTAGSVFAGVGGFDLALERAGFTVAWQAEVELAERGPRQGQPKRRQRNQEVLARHFPHARQLGDVRSVTRATAEPVDRHLRRIPMPRHLSGRALLDPERGEVR